MPNQRNTSVDFVKVPLTSFSLYQVRWLQVHLSLNYFYTIELEALHLLSQLSNKSVWMQ